MIYSFLYLLSGFFIVRYARKVFGAWLNPVGGMAGLWLGGLALAESGIIYYKKLEYMSVFWLLGSMVCFCTGAWIIWMIFRPERPKRISHVQDIVLFEVQLRATLILFACLVIPGAYFYYSYVNKSMGLDVVIYDPRSLRYEESYGFLRKGDGQVNPLAVLRSLSVPMFGLICAYVQIPRGLHRYRRMLAIMTGLAVLMLLLLNTGRTSIFAAMVVGLSAATYTRTLLNLPPISWKRTVLSGAAIIAALSVYFTITSGLLSKDVSGESLAALTPLPESLSWMVMPMHYYAGSFLAFQEMLNDPAPYVDNGNLVWGVAGTVLNKISPDQFKYPEYLQPFCETPLTTNIYTYLDAFFISYGYWGIFFFPLCLGAICGFCYSLMQKRASLWTLYVMMLLTYAMFSSVIVYRFLNFETVYWLIAGWLLIVGGRLLGNYFHHAVLAKEK